MRVNYNVHFQSNGGAAYGIRHFDCNCFYRIYCYKTITCYFWDWWGDNVCQIIDYASSHLTSTTVPMLWLILLWNQKIVSPTKFMLDFLKQIGFFHTTTTFKLQAEAQEFIRNLNDSVSKE